MNIGCTLIPIATAAVQAVATQAVEVAKGGLSFAHALATTDMDSGNNQLNANSASADLTPGDTVAAGQTQLDMKRDHIRALLHSVHTRLAARFKTAGIDLSEAVTLTTDSSGRVLESGGHLDRADVEQILDADPQLKADVRRLLEQVAELAESTPTFGVDVKKTDLRLVLDEQGAFFTSRSA